MGLRTLLSDLTGGMSNYPNHEQDRSGFTNPSISQKSLNSPSPPLISPATWDIADPNADPTYRGNRPNYSDINVLDTIERGGIQVSISRQFIDAQRITNFFTTFAISGATCIPLDPVPI